MTEEATKGSHRLAAGLGAFTRACACWPLRLGGFGLLALLLAWPALGTAGAMNMFRDAQVLMPYEDHAVDTVLRFGQLPLWDPFYCGGIFSLGTPQSRFASPTFLVSLLFGTLRAEAVTAFLMIWIGLEGTYLYARSRSASALGSVLAAPVFAASGNFATAFFHGWINFYGFALLPWALYGVRRAACGSTTGIAVGAFSLAWIVGFGGTYAAPMVALLCALEAVEAVLLRVRQPRDLAKTLSAITMVATFGIGLSALRLLPVLETFAASQRFLADRPGWPVDALYQGLFGELRFAGSNLAGPDGAYFVGLLALPAAILGALRLKSIPVLLLGAASLWAATGFVHGWSPFVGLRALPLFSTLRYPERYLIVLALALSVLAAWGITRLEDATRKHVLWSIPLGALSLALVLNFLQMIPRHHEPIEHMDLVEPPPRVERPFHQARGTRWALGYYGPMSRGCLSCWDAYPVPQSPLLRADLQQEEYLVDPSDGSVKRTAWSPNRIDLEANLADSARLRVNQNWHPGWRSNLGSVVNDHGLLAVDLPSGRHDLTLRFLPRSAIAGLLGSLAAALALAHMLFRHRSKPLSGRTGGRHLLFSLSPFVLIGLVHLLIPQPAMEPPSPLTPTGDVVVTDSLPSGVTPINVEFSPGVTLLGAKVSPDVVEVGQDLTVELVWQVGDEVPKSAGVFVHVVGESGGFFGLDHTRLSGAFELAAAPRKKVLRDVVVHRIPPSLAKKRWVVWAGVWRALGDGTRLPISSAGDGQIDGDRVQVGSFVVR